VDPVSDQPNSAGLDWVGRYEQVLDHLGEPVNPARYLVVARKAVIDATSVPIENLPLDTFDARTRFPLGWARLYRRSTAPKSDPTPVWLGRKLRGPGSSTLATTPHLTVADAARASVPSRRAPRKPKFQPV
jgi:hypothetical protein